MRFSAHLLPLFRPFLTTILNADESWGFSQTRFEQPEHMKQWVKPEFVETIGFLIYEKQIGRS